MPVSNTPPVILGRNLLVSVLRLQSNTPLSVFNINAKATRRWAFLITANSDWPFMVRGRTLTSGRHILMPEATADRHLRPLFALLWDAVACRCQFE
ncbi:unnamed protein product [Lasius platythorax]|uniref:Uncharacterized protein n=1 Tax=Lasius platythorax TaxID=488582 RepID=A0AAV2N041_9HYME